jgi:CelD/BcsL family acetyltransferase involved in cellulose biosynthesis
VSPTLEILPRLCPVSGLRAEVETEERCPVLELPASWDAYLDGLSGKDRHELRRKMRKLERELPGTSVRSHAALEGWDDALAEFLRLHRLSKVGKARFMDERMEAFFQDATRALAGAGWARLWFLDWNGSAVASFLCLEYAGAVGLYNSGFDPAHAKLAPGIVLLAHVIRDAIERGVPVFDFLRGEEPYKYAFGPTAHDLFRVSVHP